MADPRQSFHVDLCFIHNAMIVNVLSHTADAVAAHGPLGTVQIIHIHLAVCLL